MGYRVSVYQTYTVGDCAYALETSRVIRCRFSKARIVAREIYKQLSKDNKHATVYVALFKGDERVFLMSKEQAS